MYEEFLFNQFEVQLLKLFLLLECFYYMIFPLKYLSKKLSEILETSEWLEFQD